MPKKSAKQRVRLGKQKDSRKAVEAMGKARDKSYKEAPRTARGKILNGYSYKAVLEGYRENGLQPTVIGPGSNVKPAFVVQPNLGKRIVRLIRKGYPYTTVCRYCGITPKTFRDWLDRGREGFSIEYVEFYEAVAKAEAFAEMRTLNKLKTHENADWRVSAWQLERRWPEHWSKKDRMVAENAVNVTVNVDSKESLSQKVVTDDAARELARKLIDGDAFDYNKALPAPNQEEEEA